MNLVIQLSVAAVVFIWVMLWPYAAAAQSFQTKKQPIRLAPLPMVSSTEMLAQFHPFAEFIASVTGQPVDLVCQADYKKIIDELLNDTIDLACLAPLPYVILNRQDSSFIPIARFNNAGGVTTYTCSLVTFDFDITDKSGAQPRVALTQPYSTCGYLYTKQLLQKNNLNLADLPYYYAGQPSSCALDVLGGKADMSTIKTSIARQYDNLGLRIIESSDPLPGFLLVATPRTLRAETINTIRSQLIHLDPRHNKDDAAITACWGEMIRYGAIATTAANYEHIDTLLDQTPIAGLEQ